MKRSYLKRGTKSLKRTLFKQKAFKSLRRTKFNVVGHSSTSDLKKEIQALLRTIVILRDGGCILRKHRMCGGDIGQAILQADHLITRANSATFADSRLVVCVCRSCHGWKSLGSNLRKAQYDELVKTILSKERVELWERCEKDSWMPVRTGGSDWKLAIIGLKQELKKYEKIK